MGGKAALVPAWALNVHSVYACFQVPGSLPFRQLSTDTALVNFTHKAADNQDGSLKIVVLVLAHFSD